MQIFERAAIIAHFLAGNRVELTAVAAISPSDPDEGSAEYTATAAS